MSFLCKYGYAVKKNTLSESDLKDLRKTLTISPGLDNAFSFKFYIESTDYMYIPVQYGMKRFPGSVPRLSSYIGQGMSGHHTFSGTLYDYQEDAKKAVLESLELGRGAILCLKTGQGKTITAISILSTLARKTLIIVNKISLVEQWKNEIKTFLPSIKSVGIIQGKNVEIENDICIAMVQSIHKYTDKNIFKDFGCVIVDECHNICSRIFSRVLFKINCRYTIGLTATPTRSDGCDYLFSWAIGDIVYKSIGEFSGKPPIIHLVKMDSPSYTNKVNDSGKIMYSSMITDLINMKERNGLICSVIIQLVQEKRKLLVLSERRCHLETLSGLLVSLGCTARIGMFVGGMKLKDLEESRKANVILATYSAFSEGVSEKDLDTLLLLTPKKYVGHLKDFGKNESGKLEQICGRIFRKKHTDLCPVIIDFKDNFSVYIPQANSRLVFYKSHFKNAHFVSHSVDLANPSITIRNNFQTFQQV